MILWNLTIVCVVLLWEIRLIHPHESVTDAFTKGNNDVKIVGGDKASIKEFPYLVAIHMHGALLCGGSILTQEHILTAAHCFEDDDYYDLEAYRVSVGTTDIQLQRPFREIRIIFIHPTYMDDPYLFNDIGLVVLHDKLIWDDLTKPIKIPNVNAKENDTCVIAGWGSAVPLEIQEDSTEQSVTRIKQSKKNNTDAILRKAKLHIINSETCGQTYLGEHYIDHSKWICAAENEVDTCQGDSGGPLVVNGMLVGVNSFGGGCADGRYPGVYANVTHYASWIQEMIDLTNSFQAKNDPNEISYAIIITLAFTSSELLRKLIFNDL